MFVETGQFSSTNDNSLDHGDTTLLEDSEVKFIALCNYNYLNIQINYRQINSCRPSFYYVFFIAT